MPKLFEYKGIILYVWALEHAPIHVHGKKQGSETVAEFIFDSDQLVDIQLRKSGGKRPLEPKDEKHFEEFVVAYHKQIIDKIAAWRNGESIAFERIEKL